MPGDTVQFTAGGFEAAHDWTPVDYRELDRSASPVVVGSIATFNGWNTAELRMRNVRADGLEAFVEEETSNDAETAHATESIRFLAAPEGPIFDADHHVIGEAGVVELGQPDREHWHTIDLDAAPHIDPVVLAQVASYDGPDACHTRVQNVRQDSFEVKIEEWDAEDGPHTEEEIAYVVLESGVHAIPDDNPHSEGTPIEVQTVTTTHEWTPVEFATSFGSDPVVASRVQTENGPHEVVTRHRNLDGDGVEVRLQEEEARDGEHTEETVGVVTTPRRDREVEVGRVRGVDHGWSEFSFETRTPAEPVVLANVETYEGRDTVAPRLRDVTQTGARLRLEEETSQNEEVRHVPETASVVTFPPGPVEDKYGVGIGWADTLEIGQLGPDYWHTLDYGGEPFSDPVVFAGIQTFHGTRPAHVRLRDVGQESFDLQIEEWDYLNGRHAEETVGYLLLASGTHELADGTTVDVGTTQCTHQWFDVEFDADFGGATPATLTQCQTRNGPNAVVTRTRNVTPSGLDVRLQEEEVGEDRHDVETVGYLAIARPGEPVRSYDAKRLLDERVQGFTVDHCAFHFENDFPAGQYTLPNPIDLGPVGQITEIGDTTNGMCGGMVLAASDHFEYGYAPWSPDLVARSPEDSPVDEDPPDEDTPLFDFLSERLFDSFVPGGGNPLGAGLYQTLMNSPNVDRWWRIKKSRNQVMKEQWEGEIKPAIDRDELCPMGLIQVDTHGQLFRTGLEQIGDNHQVLAYGYRTAGDTVEIFVYDPNVPPIEAGSDDMRVQFTLNNDLGEWFEPVNIGSDDPLYAFFAVPYSTKEPPWPE